MTLREFVASIGIGAALLQARYSYSQNVLSSPPMLGSVSVNTLVSADSNTGIFRYRYTVVNSSTSTGEIASFELDITTTSGVLPSPEGLANIATGYLAIISMSNLRDLGSSIIPVGLEKQPDRWGGAISADGRVAWSQNPLPPAGRNIPPGASLSGFVVSSHGLPGIRRFFVEADLDPTLFFPGIDFLPEDQVDQAVAAQRAARAGASATGFTIGPVSPPSPTGPVPLLEFLISLKRQAAALGWFFGPGADGIVKSLDAKLDAAKDSAGRGNNAAAANQLGAFMNELDAQKGKHLNDNAYFLLKPNAQFIIGKLRP